MKRDTPTNVMIYVIIFHNSIFKRAFRIFIFLSLNCTVLESLVEEKVSSVN